jgi:hypothetical protein
MSNSSLVTYTKLSPNCNKPRNHVIDTVTIHCYVGQVTAERGCNASKFIKYNPVSGASCNYVVGYDGSIGLCVDEANRSWCSSNRANDHRAVTIEVASESQPPYAVTSQAYEALIKLVADICKRNNIKKLVWSTNKNDRVKHLNGCNMTVHRDFASKSCPGDYLYNKHGEIADRVNELLGVKKPVVKVVPQATYRAYAGKWLGEIKNYNTKDSNGYAGIQGKSMTSLVAKSNVGTLKYRVHTKGGKWLGWITQYNIKDSKLGYAGIKGKDIDAVQMTLEGTNEYAVKYRVSPKNSKNWYGWCTNMTNAAGDGYAGKFGQAIDCIQVEIIKK